MHKTSRAIAFDSRLQEEDTLSSVECEHFFGTMEIVVEKGKVTSK